MAHAKLTSWPSGDSRPVLATKISLDELCARCEFEKFRDKDDLDCFTGAVVKNDLIEPLLIMRHDGNPFGLTAFYVDFSVDPHEAQTAIVAIFKLQEDEIHWRLA